MSREREIEKIFRLRQRLTRAAIAYHDALQKDTQFDGIAAKARELEDAADAWAKRQPTSQDGVGDETRKLFEISFEA